MAKKKEIKVAKPKKVKKSVSINTPEEVTEGIIRIETGYVVKFADRREEFVGDEITALNEALKRYKIFLTE